MEDDATRYWDLVLNMFFFFWGVAFMGCYGTCIGFLGEHLWDLMTHLWTFLGHVGSLTVRVYDPI